MLNIYKTKAMKKFIADDFYNPNFNDHHIAHKHMLVVGGTGTGKTSFVVNLLYKMTNTFAKVIVACKMLDEPAYKMLKSQLKDAVDIIDVDVLPTLKSLPKSGQTLIIIDDFVAMKSQQKLRDYVIYARKYNIMLCFLAQSFYAVDKVIRQNVGYIVLLSMADKRNLGMIISTVGSSLDPKVIAHVIKNATKSKMNVCIIDIANPNLNQKLRRNFNDFYTLEDSEGDLLDLNEIQLYTGSGMLN